MSYESGILRIPPGRQVEDVELVEDPPGSGLYRPSGDLPLIEDPPGSGMLRPTGTLRFVEDPPSSGLYVLVLPPESVGHPIWPGADWVLCVEAAFPPAGAARWGEAVWGEAHWSRHEWIPLTDDVTGIRTQRGAFEPYANPETGEMVLSLEDVDGRYDPFRSTEAYAAYLGPGTLIRVAALQVNTGAEVYWCPIWTGVVESWVPRSDGAEAYRWVEVTAIETVSYLAGVDFRELPSPVGAGETSAVRMWRLLNDARWPYGLVDEKASPVPLTSTTMAQNRLTEAKLTAASVDGYFLNHRSGVGLLSPADARENPLYAPADPPARWGSAVWGESRWSVLLNELWTEARVASVYYSSVTLSPRFAGINKVVRRSDLIDEFDEPTLNLDRWDVDALSGSVVQPGSSGKLGFLHEADGSYFLLTSDGLMDDADAVQLIPGRNRSTYAHIEPADVTTKFSIELASYDESPVPEVLGGAWIGAEDGLLTTAWIISSPDEFEVLTHGPYSYAEHAFVRVDNDGEGTIRWLTSPDGLRWTTVREAVVPGLPFDRVGTVINVSGAAVTPSTSWIHSVNSPEIPILDAQGKPSISVVYDVDTAVPANDRYVLANDVRLSRVEGEVQTATDPVSIGTRGPATYGRNDLLTQSSTDVLAIAEAIRDRRSNVVRRIAGVQITSRPENMPALIFLDIGDLVTVEYGANRFEAAIASVQHTFTPMNGAELAWTTALTFDTYTFTEEPAA